MTQRESPIPSRSAADPDPREEWCGPVDPLAYERRLTLSTEELRELEQLLARQKLPPRLSPTLEQVMQPVYTLFERCAAARIPQVHARRIFLVEMVRRQRPFWAWTEDDWSQILCANAVAFAHRYCGAQDCRQLLLAVAYWFGHFTAFQTLGEFSRKLLSNTFFGEARMHAVLLQVQEGVRRWGSVQLHNGALESVVRELLLRNRSPYLEDLTLTFLLDQLQHAPFPAFEGAVITLSHALMGLELLPRALSRRLLHPDRKRYPAPLLEEGTVTVAPAWLQACQRWCQVSTLSHNTRHQYYRALLQVGRWLTQQHPEALEPGAWTREFAAIFVAFVDHMRVGEWAEPGQEKKIANQERIGQPLTPRAKVHVIAAVRTFFLDCQNWEWIARRFDPHRCLSTPRSVQALIGPDPRVIQTDVWAKLLWAGLSLQQEDIASWTNASYKDQTKRYVTYPLELVRAMAIVWLFCGLRSDEWSRLRVGCVRWQRDEVRLPGTEEVLGKEGVCLLDVPIHKTGTAFTKPVDRVVGEAIARWEASRPAQSPRLDPKTNEEVHFLFSFRDKHVEKSYLNKVLIGLLCKKAGVPRQDVRGAITSHRARSTIATQLFNAAEPLSLFELQEWLGHRYLSSTQQYAKVSPTRLAQSKAKAAYFERNLRLIDVLIDQEAIKSGAAGQGQPWRYYDLGHGLCTYDFFDQCPHRMACAKCAFYVPKGSSLEQILEGKANLLRLKQELTLTEEEMAAVDDGFAALETLSQKLLHIATPAGPTPHRLQESVQNTGSIPV